MNSNPTGVINDREKWKYKVAVTSGKRYVIVSDPPKVAVRSDKRATNPVTEGTKVVLLCDIIATPEANKIRWYHEVSASLICMQFFKIIRSELLCITSQPKRK